MKSKAIIGIVLTLLFVGMLPLAFKVQRVEASGTIYIKADGSIDPPTANITSLDNITYTFTGNIFNNSIIVERNNIVVDGAGYTLQGTGNGTGITLPGRSNVTIKNTAIKNWTYGIVTAYSSGNTITNNTVTSNGEHGIVLTEYSCNNNISSNTVTSNEYAGIVMLSYCNNNAVSGNEVTLNQKAGIVAQSYSSSNTISNNTVASNGYDGIALSSYSDGNTVTDNTATNNSLHGISLRMSGGNTLRDNNMSDNRYGFSVWSDLNRVSDYIHNIDTSNTVNGKPVYYWMNQRDKKIPADAGSVFAVNCINITVEDLNLTKNGVGVRFVNTTDSTIRNVTALNNTSGIHLIFSVGNTISSSTITSLGFYRPWQDPYFGPPGWLPGWGIILTNSSSNTVSGNMITNSDYGFGFGNSSGNTLSDNTIMNNNFGIGFGDSNNNTISSNTITNNDLGVSLEDSRNNTIYHNNFINNTVQANVTSGYVNTWDDGYPSGGNYWSNYTDVDLYSGSYQNETGSDGIWDHPYVLDTNNKDRYPLMIPRMKTVVHTVWSEILNVTSSWNDTDPGFGALPFSGECNVTLSSPDVNGVINMTLPKGSGYIKPAYNPISNITAHPVYISDSYGKLYTIDGVGDVDIISMTNDTGTFFKNWTDGTWHPAGEEWIGNGTPDPAGSAWFTGMLNVSHYLGNGTDGPLIGSYLSQFWITTGFAENTVDEPNSRLNDFYVNATGVPFLPPYVGTIGTYVSASAKLNIPFGGEHLDVQSKTNQLQVTPKAIMFTLFSPANLYVTDPENKHIGTHPTTGEPVNEIPGAFYSGPGSHPQRIVIPNPVDGVYDIKVIGTSSGEYTLVVELATVEKTTTHSYTGNISAGQILESQATISEDEMTSTPPSPPVGGISIPVNKLSLLAPYIALTILLAAAVVTVVYAKKRKRNTEIIP